MLAHLLIFSLAFIFDIYLYLAHLGLCSRSADAMACCPWVINFHVFESSSRILSESAETVGGIRATWRFRIAKMIAFRCPTVAILKIFKLDLLPNAKWD